MKKENLIKDIVKNGNLIVNILNNLNIIPQHNFQFQTKQEDENGVYVSFKLDDNTYSRAYYYINKKNIIKSVGRGVYSNLSNNTGTFLFYLQLLLVILLNVSKFSLDNMTDNPGRAAKGIYSLLKPKIKNYNYNNYNNLTIDKLNELLLISEGEMQLQLTNDSYYEWKKSFIDLINNKIQKNNTTKFWNEKIIDLIPQFINQIEQNKYNGESQTRLISRTPVKTRLTKRKRSIPFTRTRSRTPRSNTRSRSITPRSNTISRSRTPTKSSLATRKRKKNVKT